MSAPKPVVPGTKYSLLTIIDEAESYVQPNGRLRRKVNVSCDCGNTVCVMLENLYAGYSKSCGCVLKEKMTIHGMIDTNFKDVHCNMKARCDNPQHPQYKDYGGRGITYCEKWKHLSGFMEDMYETYEQGLSIDRILVNGNYEKGNCRWTTMSVQGHNKRKMENCIFEYKGVRYNLNKTRYVANININKTNYYLATFDVVEHAAKAYDDASEIFYQDRPNQTEPKDDFILQLVMNKIKEKELQK